MPRSIKVLYLLNRMFTSPLEAIFTLLIFILNNELQATPLQLTVLASTKPAVSLLAGLAALGASAVFSTPRRFLIAMILLGSFPVLLFPFAENAWYFIGSYALFMIALRASSPVCLEILKNHLSVQEFSKLIAQGSSLNYVLLIFIPLGAARILDADAHVWKSLFPFCALFQILAVFLLLKLKSSFVSPQKPEYASVSFANSMEILKNSPGFAGFHAAFFLGGAGLVALHPFLPVYFENILHLSYTQMALALSLCRGVGFILSGGVWAKNSKKMSLFGMNALVNLLSAFFVVFLWSSSMGVSWLFCGYLLYGSMQAGCELNWNLSGPVFSKDRPSIPYSGMALSFIGLRGCLCPFFGQAVFLIFGLPGIFGFAGGLCLSGFILAYILAVKNARNCVNSQGAYVSDWR